MRPSILTFVNIRALGILAMLSIFALLPMRSAHAVTTTALNCTQQYQIVQTFSNQAKWEMCWEPRAGYGYRLKQVIFTPPNGVRRKVLDSTHVAQLFVPYDENGARFFDISYGTNLAVLSAAECPSGTLLTNSTLCLVNRPAGYSYKNLSTGESAQGESFAVFGYFGLGQYYYIFQYTFFDDGSIEPAIGASGSLQRFAGTLSTGWPVGSQMAVNHNHFVIWRMDFDVDGTANNRVERISFAGAGTDQRNMSVTPLTTEAKETNNLNNMTFWRVRNTVENNADGRSISYEIEPSVTDQLRAPEDFTQNDFYLTQFKSTEEIVDSGLVGFVNGETVTDPVLWYTVNFHHTPRGEDDIRMPAHWQGFRIRPRDLTIALDSNPSNHVPTITNPGAQTSTAGTPISNLAISANDSDGDLLIYSAIGLPSGLGINNNTGIISGTPSTAGSFTPTITVNDGRGGTASTSFGWTVSGSSGSGTQIFSAPAAITIRDNNTASPFPASVNVSGMSGAISKVVVKLNGLTHTFPADLDVLLVSPSGQKVLLMSDAGGGSVINGITLTLDSAAAAALPQSSGITSGTYRPADYTVGSTADNFPAPAPTGPWPTDLTLFNGSSPNGTWNLFVLDDTGGDLGQIANGFSLTITTGSTADNTPPTVNTKTPAAGATGISLGTTVTAALSEAMTAATISGSTFTLQGPGTTAVPATVTYSSGSFTATLTPNSALTPNTTYTVTLKGGTSGVKDLAGNPLQTDVTWSFTTAATSSGTQTFSAPAAITISDNITASPYPASVNVSGMSGAISKVVVKLNGLTHTFPADLDVLLVSPSGQKVLLMSDAGGGTDLNGITLTLDAAAAAALPQSSGITTGTYRPADYTVGSTADNFPAPSPTGPWPTDLTLFNGSSPNGDWKLFVLDDTVGDFGQIASGFSLTITTQ